MARIFVKLKKQNMKKTLLSLTLLTSLSLAAWAQNAKTTSTVFNKTEQQCVTADYQMPGNLVEGALKKKFADAKLGSDSKASDGFRVFKGVTLSKINAEKMDLYYKVDEKKPLSTVSILTSKGYDNFIKKETDSSIINNTILFLNNFVNDVNAFKLNKDIEAQQEVIEIAEKKNKSIAKEGESLLKSKSKTESKQSQNNIEIGSLKSDMENQQKTLETIKTKTATIEQMDALKKEVSKQEDVVKKATKRYDNAINDAEYFVKELKENALEIQQNKTDQENQIAEVKKQKDILESLKAELAKIVIQ